MTRVEYWELVIWRTYAKVGVIKDLRSEAQMMAEVLAETEVESEKKND